MLSKAVVAIAWIVLVLTGVVRAEPLPQPKIGSCPSGYRESGGYCAPTSDRTPDSSCGAAIAWPPREYMGPFELRFRAHQVSHSAAKRTGFGRSTWRDMARDASARPSVTPTS
jgi:hypothetical protein